VDFLVLIIFFLVYLGMVLGEIPGLALDRSGIALLGAIALIAAGRLAPAEAWLAIDTSTIALLFGLMVLSAQFRLGGFYTEVVRRIDARRTSPEHLLWWIVGSAGVLSAVLANDIVCLAMAPMLVEMCGRRQLAPMPYLLALACASNVGSAATLIGNPQNMLIGQSLHLSFAGYLLFGVPPAVVGLGIVWWVVRATWRAHWHEPTGLPLDRRAGRRFDRWQTVKGGIVLAATIAAFLFTSWPRDVVALTAAGVLLLSRRMASREMIGLIDWHLLVLFAGLFIVNDAVARAGVLARVYDAVRDAGIDLGNPAWLFAITPVLSNLVSNVPGVMLLLPAATGAVAGPILALSSTLAGNLLIVGSIANIIVADEAGRRGIRIDWRAHARVGVPVTLATLVVAAAWLMTVSSWK
jgi:Na+/H+ antiporter NhaD/arsenite permease-like protein